MGNSQSRAALVGLVATHDVAEAALFFQADGGDNGNELWTSDGTAAGTVMLKDINPSGDSNPVRVPPPLSRAHTLALVTPPTPSRPPSAASVVQAGFTVFNGKLFFQADDGGMRAASSSDIYFVGVIDILIQ